MKSSNRIKSLLLTLSAITKCTLWVIATATIINTPQVKAQEVSFQEQPVNQQEFNVVAVPFGYQEHRLEIIEQIPGKQQCWAESGTAPVEVDLLLLNFDHTDSCRRIINTNGYTLRLNGQDETVAHVIKIVENNGELQLVAFHKDPSQPSIVIGRTNGLSNKAMKIMLNPGWQITKRVYQGKAVEHLYLSGNTGSTSSTYSASSNNSSNSTSSSSTSTSTTVTQRTATPNSTQPNDVDTKALVNGVEQIYNNVVTPLLYNLSQENTNGK